MAVLHVIATPIGNLDDITIRAVRLLKEADIVACEDTRRAAILLTRYGIRKKLLRYDDHVHPKAAREIMDALRAGQNVALVTDAGTPGISDPGNRLVADVVRENYGVVGVPGPCSVTMLLSIAGFSGEGFVFLGFFPRKEGAFRRLLREAFGLGRTIVGFESPFRIQKTLALIEEEVPGVPLVVGRELTKKFEEIFRGQARDVRKRLEKSTAKGEFILAIGPKKTKKNE